MSSLLTLNISRSLIPRPSCYRPFCVQKLSGHKNTNFSTFFLDKQSQSPLTLPVNQITDFRRGLSSGAQKASTGGEQKIKSILHKSFPSASTVVVEDISGGCGSMYQVFVESRDFEGLSIVKQHQLVNKALKEEIKDMHGIRIQTQAPK